MDIGPGDWVECVLAPREDDHIQVPLGSIWCVAAIEDADIGCNADPDCDAPIFELVGQPRDKTWGFCGCTFRPIYRPKQEIIEALKAPPKRVKEVA